MCEQIDIYSFKINYCQMPDFLLTLIALGLTYGILLKLMEMFTEPRLGKYINKKIGDRKFGGTTIRSTDLQEASVRVGERSN